jgi:hypothetical protein
VFRAKLDAFRVLPSVLRRRKLVQTRSSRECTDIDASAHTRCARTVSRPLLITIGPSAGGRLPCMIGRALGIGVLLPISSASTLTCWRSLS